MLKHFGVTPYIVFDGDYLPSKSKTEKERAARRKESKRLGMRLLELGKTAQAYLELQKAVDVTPEMAGQLIEELKLANVQYVVAPYEADSQLAYLERKGIIDGILSEDSDLLVFGAKRLLTKLDQYGECVLIRRDDFAACKEISLVGWSDQEFRRMTIMSGCDYLTNIDKMGLKTAYRLIRKHKTMDRIIRAVQFDGKFKVPPGYLESFTHAEMTFLHQWVFCPLEGRLVNCTPLEEGVEASDMPYIGGYVEPVVAAGVARGELHPHTKEPLKVTVAPKRNMYPPHRRDTSVETPELKKNKSIESFFQPKRTPLAELDPNSFASTPGQQQLLRRASGSSWPATPTTQGTPDTSNRRAMMPVSAPITTRRSVSDNLVTRSHSDRLTKRRRLCADGSSPVSAKNASRVESGRSKFFMQAGDAASPSKGASDGRTSSKQNTEINLWSDDSIEEALLHLPEPESHYGTIGKTKRIEVFTDNGSIVKAAISTVVSTGADASQGTTSSIQTQLFSPFTNNSTPINSPVSGRPTAKTVKNSLFDSLAEVRDFAKFAYHSSQTPPKRSNTTTTATTLSRIKTAPSIKSPFHVRLPKKRVSPGDLPVASIKHVPLTDPVADPVAEVDPPPRVGALANEGLGIHRALISDIPDIEDSAWLEHDSKVMVPASDEIVPPSPVKRVGKFGSVTCGSEDLLVAESESEDGESNSPKAKATFDLGRYMFGGQ
jgi:exonuclease-1